MITSVFRSVGKILPSSRTRPKTESGTMAYLVAPEFQINSDVKVSKNIDLSLDLTDDALPKGFENRQNRIRFSLLRKLKFGNYIQ